MVKKHVYGVFILIFFIIAGLYCFQSVKIAKKTLPAIKIAVVDWDHIVSDLTSMQTFKENLNKTFQKYQQKFQRQEQELRAESQELQDIQAPTQGKISTVPVEMRRKQFNEKVLSLQKEAELYQKRLNDYHQYALKIFHEQAHEKIKILAKKRRIQVVFSKSQTLFVESDIDITAELMEALKDIRIPSFYEEKA